MGTSALSKGVGGATPLVPSWLGGPELSPSSPATLVPSAPESGDPSGGQQAGDSGPREASTSPFDTQRFSTAKKNFTRYTAGGGETSSKLGRAVRSYVNRSSGGPANAARRMGSARATASNILGMLRSFERDGIEATLARYNLEVALAGDPSAALSALTDAICPEGGLIDEAISRDAWIETVGALEELGIADLGAMSPEQRQELFGMFIANSITARILNDIGERGFKVAGDLDDIRAAEQNLRDYVSDLTRSQIRASFPGSLKNVSDDGMKRITEKVYRAGWEILSAYGEE